MEKSDEILKNHQLWARGEGGDGANLVRAHLVRADLIRVDLTGAVFKTNHWGSITVKKHGYFCRLYKYYAIPIIAEDGKEYVKLGCYLRSVNAWKRNFWNNPREFPNKGDEPSKKRMEAFQACLKWLEENR